MDIVLLTLATYGVSWALTQSDGAWGILYITRANKQVNDFGLLECVPCTAGIVSGTLVLGFERSIGIIGWLAVWGACIVLYELVSSYKEKE